MEASFETLAGLERRLKFSVPAARINSEVQSRLKRLARDARMPGFRPGKVPFRILQQQYGGQVFQEVLGDTLQKSFGDAVRERNLRVAGYPRFEAKQPGEDAKELEYTATFEIYPELAIGDISGVRVERPVVSVTEADVDKTIEILRKQRVRYEPVERGAR